MKRPARATPAPARPRRRAPSRPRAGGGQASRPSTPMRRRVGARLPSIRRAIAAAGALAGVAVLVALVNGPWLRVDRTSTAGARYTPPADVDRVLASALDVSALAVDTDAMAARLEALPTVAEARVEVGLDGRISATVVERAPAFVWRTSMARFIGAADGTLFAAGPAAGPLDPDLVGLPLIDDRRFGSRLMVVGDVIPDGLLRAGLQLARLDPARLGSAATEVAVRLDDRHGFRLTSLGEGWEIAFGMYGVDPDETDAAAAARLESQVAAVRTLFATRPEAEIAWVDARNPGKVYFRAKG